MRPRLAALTQLCGLCATEGGRFPRALTGTGDLFGGVPSSVAVGQLPLMGYLSLSLDVGSNGVMGMWTGDEFMHFRRVDLSSSFFFAVLVA